MKFAVVQHVSGRIDAEAIEDLARRSMAIFRAGECPPKYCLLELHPTLQLAAARAAALRSERRKEGINERTDRNNSDNN